MTQPLRISRDGTCHGESQFVRLDAGPLVELYGRVQPRPDAAGLCDQVRSVYVGLEQLLSENALAAGDVVCERLFFSDIVAQAGTAQQLRTAVYGGHGGGMPAASFLQQPPCQHGRLFELQVFALHSRDGSHRVSTLSGLGSPASGKLVTAGGLHHLYLHNLVGGDGGGFRAQCTGVFENLAAVLRAHEVPVSQLVRTWIYLRDLDRDYGELNELRNGFFADWGIRRLPASTGIQGGTFPARWRCTLDAYAVWGQAPLTIAEMHGDSLGAAPDYGAAFSRGLRVDRDDRTLLYISGTASIDRRGCAVHVGDAEGQMHRMLDNVESLLDAQGARLEHAVSAVSYLKCPSFLRTFAGVCRARGVPPGLVNSVVMADICRPEWLCEIELTAVVPARTD